MQFDMFWSLSVRVARSFVTFNWLKAEFENIIRH